MEDCAKGLDSSFDELPPTLQPEPFRFFAPGAKRSIRYFRSLTRFPDAAEAGLGWLLLSGKLYRFTKCAILYDQARTRATRRLRPALANAERIRLEPADVHLDQGTTRGGDAIAQVILESAAGRSYSARLALARLAQERGEYEIMQIYLRDMFHWHPMILHLRAVAHAGMGEYGMAEKYYRRIVGRFPAHSVFLENHAGILSQLTPAEEARMGLEPDGELKGDSAKMVYS